MIVAVIQSSTILFIALSGVLVLRRQPAATRHAILTVGLVSSVAVPFLGGVAKMLCGNCGTAGVTLTLLTPAHSSRPSGTLAIDIGHTSVSATDQATVPSIPMQMAKHTFRWIWFGGIAIMGTALIAGLGRIISLVARSEPVDSRRWVSASEQISKLLRLKRKVRLLQNDRTVLGTLGIVRPKVFVPFDSAEWSDDRIRLVLTHELAHIKRLDWPVQLLAELARAVYWFNPLFWFACRWLRAESEHACDDVVLNNGFDPKDYAAHLLDLARTLKNGGAGWSPVLAMSRPPNLERRFVAMLNPSWNHRPTSRLALFAIGVVALCVTFPLAAMRAPAAEQLLPSVALEEATVVPAILPSPKAAPPVSTARTSRSAVPKPAAVQGLADGSLSGTVYDLTGAVVPDVRITVAKVDLQTVVETTTGSAGEYELRALSPGLYLLTAQRPGFMNAAKRIEVRSSQTSQQNITLSVGGVAERVRVSAVGQSRPAPFPGQQVRVGGNVQPPRLIGQVKPVYPPGAQNAGIEGTVHLQGIIAADGTLLGLHALDGVDADLINAAVEAAKQWRYLPATLNGVAIEVVTQIDIEFKLLQ